MTFSIDDTDFPAGRLANLNVLNTVRSLIYLYKQLAGTNSWKDLPPNSITEITESIDFLSSSIVNINSLVNNVNSLVNVDEISFTPGGTIAANKLRAAILEASSEALQKSNDLSDLTNKSTAWNNLGAAQSLGASGWTKLPNGLILQWRRFQSPTANFAANTTYSYDVVFPIAFNTVYSCVGNISNGFATYPKFDFGSLTTSRVTVYINYPGTITNGFAVFTVFATGI